MKQKTKLRIGAIASLVVALVYMLMPVDVVPDAVPVLGWIDDLVAILIAVGNALRIVSKIRKID